MRTAMLVLLALALLAGGCEDEAATRAASSAPPAEAAPAEPAPPAADADETGTVYAFTLEDIDGRPVDLSRYRGRTLLIVNVASRCGNTPQYAALQELHETYRDRGLVVLGFPANDFGNQEPGTAEEIKAFCTERYGVTFPLFAKIHVKGEEKHPLYVFLTEQGDPAHRGEVRWNFAKFLVGPDGRVVDRFAPGTAPDSLEVLAAIERTLNGQGG